MMAVETSETRAKRLKMRSWRRGTKEMDMILGPFCDSELAGMSEGDIALYERLLEENDQDLYKWVTGSPGAPGDLAALIGRIAAFAGA